MRSCATTDGKASETAADENTPVLPGDVIKVGRRRSLPAPTERPPARSQDRHEDRQGALRQPGPQFLVRLRAVALSIFVFAYSTRFGQVSVLAYYALWLPLIARRLSPGARQLRASPTGSSLSRVFACLSVFWSAAPGVTARAGLQLLSHIVCALIAARTDRHPDADARRAGRHHARAASIRWPSAATTTIRSTAATASSAHSRRRTSSGFLRLARHLFRLRRLVHPARARPVAAAGALFAAACPAMRWSPRNRRPRSSPPPRRSPSCIGLRLSSCCFRRAPKGRLLIGIVAGASPSLFAALNPARSTRCSAPSARTPR